MPLRTLFKSVDLIQAQKIEFDVLFSVNFSVITVLFLSLCVGSIMKVFFVSFVFKLKA